MEAKTKKRKAGRPGTPRFRIEKLEERIAPTKGGIPGWACGGYGYGRFNPHGKPLPYGKCACAYC